MKITKKNSEKFFNSIKDFIINELKGEGGQTRFDHNRYEYVINTIAGTLNISLYDNQNGSELYTMFTRFDNPLKARMYFNEINPNSGKYNFHASHKDINTIIEWAKMHLECTQEKVA